MQKIKDFFKKIWGIIVARTKWVCIDLRTRGANQIKEVVIAIGKYIKILLAKGHVFVDAHVGAITKEFSDIRRLIVTVFIGAIVIDLIFKDKIGIIGNIVGVFTTILTTLSKTVITIMWPLCAIVAIVAIYFSIRAIFLKK